MAYRSHHYPGGYGATYYEEQREVIRDPCDSYASEYRVQEYANPGYPHHHHHNDGYTDRVTEVVSYESNPGYLGHHHHHHHGGVAEIVEKRQEIIYEDAYDPYRRGLPHMAYWPGEAKVCEIIVTLKYLKCSPNFPYAV